MTVQEQKEEKQEENNNKHKKNSSSKKRGFGGSVSRIFKRIVAMGQKTA